MSCLKEKKINDDPTLKKNFFEKYSVMASVGNNFKQVQKDKSGDITFFWFDCDNWIKKRLEIL